MWYSPLKDYLKLLEKVDLSGKYISVHEVELKKYSNGVYFYLHESTNVFL